VDDLEAIRQLKARYFRLMDTKQWDAWRDCFTEDVVLQTLPDPDERFVGRDQVVSRVSAILAGSVTVHHGHMPEIELLSPTEARGIWAMFDYVEFKPSRGIRGYGHYHEEYRKDKGAWHISKLKLTRLRVDPLASGA
jgi:hypothetical protein